MVTKQLLRILSFWLKLSPKCRRNVGFELFAAWARNIEDDEISRCAFENTYEFVSTNRFKNILINDASDTHRERDPWTMADWRPAPEVCLHNSAIARKLRKDEIITIVARQRTSELGYLERVGNYFTCVIGVPAINGKLLAGGYRHNRWQWQLRISVGRDMTDRRIRREFYGHANIVRNAREHHRRLEE